MMMFCHLPGCILKSKIYNRWTLNPRSFSSNLFKSWALKSPILEQFGFSKTALVNLISNINQNCERLVGELKLGCDIDQIFNHGKARNERLRTKTANINLNPAKKRNLNKNKFFKLFSLVVGDKSWKIWSKSQFFDTNWIYRVVHIVFETSNDIFWPENLNILGSIRTFKRLNSSKITNF